MQASRCRRWCCLSAGVHGAARVPNWVFVKTAGGCLSSDGYYGCQPGRPRSAAAHHQPGLQTIKNKKNNSE